MLFLKLLRVLGGHSGIILVTEEAPYVAEECVSGFRNSLILER